MVKSVTVIIKVMHMGISIGISMGIGISRNNNCGILMEREEKKEEKTKGREKRRFAKELRSFFNFYFFVLLNPGFKRIKIITRGTLLK